MGDDPTAAVVADVQRRRLGGIFGKTRNLSSSINGTASDMGDKSPGRLGSLGPPQILDSTPIHELHSFAEAKVPVEMAASNTNPSHPHAAVGRVRDQSHISGGSTISDDATTSTRTNRAHVMSWAEYGAERQPVGAVIGTLVDGTTLTGARFSRPVARQEADDPDVTFGSWGSSAVRGADGESGVEEIHRDCEGAMAGNGSLSDTSNVSGEGGAKEALRKLEGGEDI
jgi:hypothetical protein